jgi:hypothetical protein
VQAHDETVSRFARAPEQAETNVRCVDSSGFELYSGKVRRNGCKLTGKARMESASDWPVEGLLVHMAGDSPQGFPAVDVWQSEDACNRFGEALGPILQEVGVEDQPEIYEAHTFVSA